VTRSWRSVTPTSPGSPGITEPVNRFQAWKTAARPHTFPAAVVPVLVGGGLALEEEVFRWDAFVWAMIGALAIQVAANFANDVSDARRGADTPQRLGPPRMVATGVISPGRMWAATWAVIGVAAVAGLVLFTIAGPLVIVIGAVSVLAMLGYVGGPAPYGYRALGEVFVFVFFGVVATVGSRFVHDGAAPMSAWLLAVPIGLLVTAILVVNNQRDLGTDAAAGKRTLAVVLGPVGTRRLFAALVYGAYLVIAVLAMAGLTPRGTMLGVLVLPYARIPVRIVGSGAAGSELVRALKLTARAHLWTGLLLSLGAAAGL
jgi:1,4-dihydroxy-2-naphthoate polyprenyltransferase